MNSTGQTLIYLAGGLAVGAGAIYAYDRLHPAPSQTVTHTVKGTPIRKTVIRTVQGTPIRRTVTRTIQGSPVRRTVIHTVARTQRQTVTRTVTPAHTPVSTPHQQVPSLQLTVNGSQFRTNEPVTITCRASSDISGMGLLLQIRDLTTSRVKISQSYGSSWTVRATSSTQVTHQFQALLFKNGGAVANSNTVSVTWAPQANDTNAGYCNTAGQCVHLTVTNYAQSGKVGWMVHLQPQPVGFSNPVYQYWWLAPNGSWQQSGHYQNLPNYYLNANLNGVWYFTVYAREANAPSNENATQRARYEAKSNTHGVRVSNGIAPTSYPHTASGSVQISAPSSASTGQSVTLSASASGITNPVYQFWYQTPDGSWAGAGPYSASSTYTLAVNTPGTWSVVVNARPASAPSNEDAKQRAEYEVNSATHTITVS